MTITIDWIVGVMATDQKIENWKFKKALALAGRENMFKSMMHRR